MRIKSFFAIAFLLPSIVCAQWVRVPQIPERSIVYSLLALQDTLYVGTDSVMYVGAARGTQWSSGILPFATQDFISCLFKYKGTLFAGSFHHGVSFTSDLGVSWQPFSAGLSGLGALDISSIQIRRDTLIAATLGASVFATPANLSHPWTGWGDSLSDYQGDNVFKMIVVGNTVLANAGGNGYMFRYTDAQPWWNPIAMNTPRRVGQFVLGMVADGDTVVVCTNSGSYRSTNEGLSWEPISDVLAPSAVQAFLLPHGPTLFLIASTPFSSSLYSSSDLGVSWKPLGPLPFADVLDAAMVSDTLFLGLAGGLWKAPISGLVTSIDAAPELPNAFHLFQNFPNPFNPKTVVRYQLPVVSSVRLVVYDVLGREVAVLVNEQREAGSYDVTFDASGLSSGVYFYRLSVSPLARRDLVSRKGDGQAGTFTQTRKLALVR